MPENHKTVLVTGATGTIGTAISEALAAAGCRLFVSGRNKEKLAALSARLSATAIAADVADEDSVRKLFAAVRNATDRLDALVVAAGTYGGIGTVEGVGAQEWWDGVRVNLFGTMLTVKYAIPLMKERGGSMVTFSGGGEGAYPHFSSYAAAKGGIIRFTETVARELEPYQIRVNAIAPGAVISGIVQQLLAAGPSRAGADAIRRATEQLETGGVPPEKAASLVAFLVSDASRGITGRVLSAVHDRYDELPAHHDELATSDVFTWRRIKPKDRGYDW